MATCPSDALLVSAAANGFTDLCDSELWDCLIAIAQEWEGGSDSASTVISSAASNDLLFLNEENILDCIVQKLCDIQGG